MGKTTIEWADYTFNPWIGCTKVSDGCKNCYAEQYGNRFGINWGPRGLRRRTTMAYWKQPLAWDTEAKRRHVRPRVFCASLSDVFEGHLLTDLWLPDLFELIERTTGLMWMLLTKRPENIWRSIEKSTHSKPDIWLSKNPHVWIGTSIENQEQADKRIKMLLKIPASVRFLSCEPLLGEIDLHFAESFSEKGEQTYCGDGINWVICGGESGPYARAMHPNWARSLRDQCVRAGVPFFFKQWGEWVIEGDRFVRYGKKHAGRVLDGRTWDEVPYVDSNRASR